MCYMEGQVVNWVIHTTVSTESGGYHVANTLEYQIAIPIKNNLSN